MYEAHPECESPGDPNVRIWRYLDVAKFLHILETKCLFFPAACKMEDVFEGSLPLGNVSARESLAHEMERIGINCTGEMIAKDCMLRECLPSHTAINCWHMNEFESAAMWAAYARRGYGVAIESTFGRLTESILDTRKVFVGVVKYVDYGRDAIGNTNLITPFLHKRKSFEHERELRAMTCDLASLLSSDPPLTGDGVNVLVDVRKLVAKVHVAPQSDDWFRDLVARIVKRFGYEFVVDTSSLDDRPMF